MSLKKRRKKKKVNMKLRARSILASNPQKILRKMKFDLNALMKPNRKIPGTIKSVSSRRQTLRRRQETMWVENRRKGLDKIKVP